MPKTQRKIESRRENSRLNSTIKNLAPNASTSVTSPKKNGDVDQFETHQWLRTSGFKCENDELKVAAQKQSAHSQLPRLYPS